MANAGMSVDAVHTELGYGMLEVALGHAPPLEAADKAARAKLYFKQLCRERGLTATFMAKNYVQRRVEMMLGVLHAANAV